MSRAVLPLALALLLGGCAVLAPPAPVAVAGAINPRAFDLVGRVAVAGPSGNENFTLRWQRRGSDHAVEIVAPIGAIVAELTVVAGVATLRQGANAPIVADSSESLLGQVLGVPLSLDRLALWVHGSGGRPVDAHAVEIADDGWQARIEPGAHGEPKRLEAVRGAGSERVRVRLVVDEYRAAAP